MVSFLRARRRAALVVLAAALLAVGFLWLRDSSLLRVDKVEVTGATGQDAAAIRAALTAAGLDMSTMRVDEAELDAAAAPFPIVRSISADGDFPSTLKVRVNPYQPVAAVVAGGQEVPVAFDGTILRGTPIGTLPVIRMKVLPGGDRLPRGRAMRAVRVAAAAPGALRSRADRVFVTERGLTTTLREGPRLYFGPPQRLAAKWSAAARVLADEAAGGATYLDLRIPERPAVGGVEIPQEPVPEAPVEPSTSTLG